jgi:hypothetical protein
VGTIFVKMKVILLKTVVSLDPLFGFITKTLIADIVVVIFLYLKIHPRKELF